MAMGTERHVHTTPKEHTRPVTPQAFCTDALHSHNSISVVEVAMNGPLGMGEGRWGKLLKKLQREHTLHAERSQGQQAVGMALALFDANLALMASACCIASPRIFLSCSVCLWCAACCSFRIFSLALTAICFLTRSAEEHTAPHRLARNLERCIPHVHVCFQRVGALLVGGTIYQGLHLFARASL